VYLVDLELYYAGGAVQYLGVFMSGASKVTELSLPGYCCCLNCLPSGDCFYLVLAIACDCLSGFSNWLKHTAKRWQYLPRLMPDYCGASCCHGACC